MENLIPPHSYRRRYPAQSNLLALDASNSDRNECNLNLLLKYSPTPRKLSSTCTVGQQCTQDREHKLELANHLAWPAGWLTFFWTSCQSPTPNLNKIRSDVARRRDREYAAVGFAAAFRHRNPLANESEVFDYVLECWSEIGGILGVDYSDGPDSKT